VASLASSICRAASLAPLSFSGNSDQGFSDFVDNHLAGINDDVLIVGYLKLDLRYNIF